MADPKFANLPGIAYDQPDVYETPDVPEEDTSDFYEETENECIERLHISSQDSYNKFKGKYLTGHVDFSDRIGKKVRTGYDAKSGNWELAAEGEKETPIEKCRRLQCEMSELMQEISQLQNDATISKENKQAYEEVGMMVTGAKKVLDSLRLEQVLGKETVSTASDNELKKLFSQVEQYKKSGGGALLPQVPVGNTELQHTTRIAELEHRLHQLEKAIGAQPEKVSRLAGTLGTSTLLETVQQLSTKAALLQPGQLDLIEARLSNLATKMDAIAEKSSGSNQDAARDQKTLELYEIAKRTEPIVQILPNMLQRMQALENLHNYATNFSKIIAELETSQSALLTNISGNKTLLQGVQEAFAVNLENINKEVKKLETRLNAVAPAKK